MALIKDGYGFAQTLAALSIPFLTLSSAFSERLAPVRT